MRLYHALDPSDYLFDTKMACCKEWFVDVQLCKAAAPIADGMKMSEQLGGDYGALSPTPFDGTT